MQAIKVLNMIKVHGKPVRVNKASQEKKALDVGANLFIGNLDPDVDEKMLYDTFSAFGVIVATPKIMRDPDSGAPCFSERSFYMTRHWAIQRSLQLQQAFV
jgi:splicing factor 3B subunit 4